MSALARVAPARHLQLPTHPTDACVPLVTRAVVYKTHALGSDENRSWSTRVLMLPCPALLPQQRLVFQKAAKRFLKKRSKNPLDLLRAVVDIAVTSEGDFSCKSQGLNLHYAVQEATGPSTVQISTVPGAAFAGPGGSAVLKKSHGALKPDDGLRPFVRFATSGKAFSSVYRLWCEQNELTFRDVMDHAQDMTDLNIQLGKRMATRVKGVRLRAINQITIMEEVRRSSLLWGRWRHERAGPHPPAIATPRRWRQCRWRSQEDAFLEEELVSRLRGDMKTRLRSLATSGMLTAGAQ